MVVKPYGRGLDALAADIRDAVRIYNDRAQSGRLGGLSPAQALDARIRETGFSVRVPSDDAFDLIFSRRVDRDGCRTVRQGVITAEGGRYHSTRMDDLPVGARVNAALARTEAEPSPAEPDPADFTPVAAMRELLAERNTALATMSARGRGAGGGLHHPRDAALGAGALPREARQLRGLPVRQRARLRAFPAPRQPDRRAAARPGRGRLRLDRGRAICRQLDLDPSALRG